MFISGEGAGGVSGGSILFCVAGKKKARAAKPGVALTLVLLLSEVLRRGGAGPKRLRAPRGAKAEREAAAKPPRPQWGLGLLARLRERPMRPRSESAAG